MFLSANIQFNCSENWYFKNAVSFRCVFMRIRVVGML